MKPWKVLFDLSALATAHATFQDGSARSRDYLAAKNARDWTKVVGSSESFPTLSAAVSQYGLQSALELERLGTSAGRFDNDFETGRCVGRELSVDLIKADKAGGKT